MDGASTNNTTVLESGTQPMPVRRADLALSVIDGEALLYDARSGAVHCFSPTTLQVWQSCDGNRSVDAAAADFAEEFGLDYADSRRQVRRAIDELNRRRLFEEEVSQGQPFVGPYSDAAPHTDAIPVPDARESRISEPADQRSISRRELLAGGATKLALTAPVISTFFATGAYASGLSLSGSFGLDAGGACKTVGYSCAVNTDCCEEAAGATACQAQGAPTDTCCYLTGNGPCTDNTDCCGTLTCTIGVCG